MKRTNFYGKYRYEIKLWKTLHISFTLQPTSNINHKNGSTQEYGENIFINKTKIILCKLPGNE